MEFTMHIHVGTSAFSNATRSFKAFARCIAIAGFFIVALSAGAVATDGNLEPVQIACGFTDSAFDTATDIHALEEYQEAIALLLQREKFAELDCIADQVRTTKARFSGGAWKLRNFYIGLQEPRPGHPTQEDWRKHMALIERWIQLRPRSFTAQIALAESYVQYGWNARGEGYADTVSNSGWKLLGERVEKARQILTASPTLKTKCPDWYLAMQEVSQGASWDLPHTTALLKEAIAFEPDYEYYYRFYAYNLQPKWGGEEADAARFAEESANKVGGDNGDIIYFLIASKVICACQDPTYSHFSWPRLQKGFAATEKKYGPNLLNINNLAMMAVKFGDWVVAAPAFERIGDQWAKDVWLTEQWFKSNQAIAKSNQAAIARSHAIQQEAEANGQSPEGIAYRKDFDYRMSAIEQPCVEKGKEDPSEFDFYINVGKDGGVDDAWGTHPTPMMQCLMKAFYDGHVKNEKPFPAPPKAPFWVSVHIDPSKANTAMK
jgi:hypothetical protein